MKILLIFTLCLISDGGASNEVTGYSGGGVLIKCKYKTKYTQRPKYFCKETRTSCSVQIKTHVKNQWVNSGRFSLLDDTRSAEFWVMIRELTVHDTGKYYCGVNIIPRNNICTSVELEVKEDQSYEKSISATVPVGEHLTLSCKYPKSLRSKPKFLCRRLQTAVCSDEDSVKENGKYVNVGNFILYDDRAKEIFTASISNVTEQNSGEYWCGAEAEWKSDHGYKVYFTHINLRVTDLRVKGSTSVPIRPSSSSSSSSSSSASTSSLLPSSPPPSSSSSSVLTPASPPAGFPAYTAITMSVILLLLLVGILILSVVLQKRRRMRVSASRNSGNINGISSLDVCEYEEIKDTRRLSASDAGTCTVYSTAQLPKLASDHHTVANSQLPTIPCDSAIYYTAQLPTIPSDRGIYSKAQLPAPLSAEEPAEDLNYTTVGFPCSSNNTVLRNKEDAAPDYSLVRHVNSSV